MINTGLKAISSIGSAGGRDFQTIDAWLAAVKALGTISIGNYPNGVTGQCYNDTEFTPSELLFRNVDTSQFNGTGKFAITLTTAPGHSFRDNANVRANLLAYNQANGVGVNLNAVSYPITGGGITVCNFGHSGTTTLSNNILISNLQIKVSTGNFALYTDNNLVPSAGQIVVQNCIIDDFAGATPLFTGTITILRNCLIISRGPQDHTFCPHGAVFDGPAGVGAHFYGCTVVCLSDDTGGPYGAPDNAWCNTAGEGGGTTTWSNCAFFGWMEVSDQSGGAGGTYIKCATDSPTVTTNNFCNNVAFSFTGQITGNTNLTVTGPVNGNPIAIGQFLRGTGITPGATQITAGSGLNWTVTASPNVGPETMGTYVQSFPNTGSNVTGSLVYGNQFMNTTGTGTDFRVKSGANLIGAGTADSTNLPTDITGRARALTGAIDIGCYSFT